MKLDLNSNEILTLLTTLHLEYGNAKAYYETHKLENERIGVTSPDEIKDVYNSILLQVQKKQEIFLHLKPIDNK